MAKDQKKKKQTKPLQTKNNSFEFSPQMQIGLAVAALVIFLVFLLKPFVVDGLSAQGVDVVGSMGKMHQVTEYNKQADDRALWNPSLFAGMPIYHRISAQAYSVDNLLSLGSRLFSSVFMYYLLGALGFFVLARYLKMSVLVSLFGALFFILMPHYKSLYLEGHMSKLMALMYLPWIFVSFRYFLDKRSVLTAALFALSFGLQIRTQHYQIVFYSAMMVFALGVYPFIKDLLDKKFAQFGKSTALLVAALVLALAMAAQPLFLAKEYLPYSKRGKTTIDVNQNKSEAEQKKSDGVSMDYATEWSTAPSEMLTWLVPRFYGGMSGERYDGSKYSHLKGQQIPGYWGKMRFTQSYEYMGILLLLLAIWGLIATKKNLLTRSMFLFAVFLILLSMGRYFSSFYGLFYHYFPYFNKFRTPMMSVSVTYFIMVIFAMYGFNYLKSLKDQAFAIKENKTVLYTIIAFFVVGILIWLFGQNASFMKANEPYQGQTLEMIKNIRIEMFNSDLLRYFIILAIGTVIIFAYLLKKVPMLVSVALLGILISVDLFQVQDRMQKEYKDRDRVEKQYFRETATDKFLAKDSETFRIFPVGKLFGDNRWAYFHQTIGGYSPIKMYTIEELVEKNIYKGWDADLPLNWNVLKLLNVKYVVLQGQVQNENLERVFAEQQAGLVTYRLKGALSRAFFVNEFKVIPGEIERLMYINSQRFDPAQTAILEVEPAEKVAAPDSAFTKLTSFSPNKITYDVFTDKQALLVLSEVYYPPGWKISIDGAEVKNVYKTDHAVQSIVVPAGAHKIEMLFHPDSYFKNLQIASISVGILYLVIIASLVMGVLNRKKLKAKN